ncbi:MAG: hypothetical protein VX307_00270 [Chloroflexota bacterium]|nr:hypothetical protein [Chloroflexota bacterium]
MADYLYVVQMDIPAEKEADFNRIYDTQHVPNITTGPGVQGCTRFKLESADVDGVPTYLALYEIDSPDVPQSAGWVAESDKGDWASQIRPHTTNRTHLIFKKVG